MEIKDLIFNYSLRLGDSSLVIGHRLSEWCGHGPILEEDIAMTNLALDLVGQARTILTYAGEVEENDRTEDSLAYYRDERGYRNLLLVEQPNGDFAMTMIRQFLFSSYQLLLYEKLQYSKDKTIAAFAEKSMKEVIYHVRHSSKWILRLGDGTAESHERAQNVLNQLWRFTDDLFDGDEVDAELTKLGIATDLSLLKPVWFEIVKKTFDEATLIIPQGEWMIRGSRKGIHTEHLGFMLAEMQSLPRAYPDAKW